MPMLSSAAAVSRYEIPAEWIRRTFIQKEAKESMATATCGECGNETEYDETDSSDQIPCTHCNNMIEV